MKHIRPLLRLAGQLSCGIVLFSSLLGCSLINIQPSPLRSIDPARYVVNDSLSITSWGPVSINQTAFYPASFMISHQDQVIYLDPLMIGEGPPADFIFITHAHPDHCSREDLIKLTGEHTLIICPRSCEKEVSRVTSNYQVVAPGESLSFSSLDVQALPSYNRESVFLWLKAHPRQAGNTGFVLDLDGVRIYHPGDSDHVTEMDNLAGLDIVFVPLGGDKLSMSAADAAGFVRVIKPKAVIPMHYEVRDTLALQTFMKTLDPGVELIRFDVNQ